MNFVNRSTLIFRIATATIVLAALALRLYGLNWDDGWYQHPDERHIVMVMVERIHAPDPSDLGALFDPEHSPLNTRSNGPDGEPRAFAYGSLPLFVTEIVASAAGALTGQEFNSYERLGLVGRFLTALVDIGTLIMAMFVAYRVFGKVAALITGALLATSVILIQLAHFFTSDAWVTFFATGVVLASIKLREDPRLHWAVLAGALLGAALATKVSVVTLAAPIVVATLAAFWNTGWSTLAISSARRLSVAFVSCLITFMVFEPYALWRPVPFMNDALSQWSIVNAQFDVPFTRQFVGTTPVLYQIENLVRWGLGPVFGLVALLAFGLTVRRLFGRHHPAELILISGIIPYFLVIGTADAKFLRYVAPIVPALAILTGALLARAVKRYRVPSLYRFPMIGFAAIVVGATALWALAFSAIYAQPHTRVTASEWIYENVPYGSTITSEYWDDALPLPLDGQPGLVAYNHISLDLYQDRDNREAFEYIQSSLRQADYIILASDRLAGSIPRLPWRYPVIIEYYDLLDSGQLGFRLVYESDVIPSLGPFEFDDRAADESFSVYDHPRVRIYEKVEDLTGAELEQRFAWALNQPWHPQRTPPPDYLLLPRPVSEMPAASDLGWSAGWTSNGPFATVIWYIAASLLGLVTLPVSLMLFGRFADVGWGLSRALGLLATGYLVWISVSLELVSFALSAIAGCIVVLSMVIWIGFRSRIFELFHLARANLHLIAVSEFVFFAAFTFFLLMRSIYPDLWQVFYGGEKPMEMSYISSIARSGTFTPYDPWFADGVMNYYYYGFYLIALLWKLTGVPPEVGFQLAMATISAMLVSAVFSLTSTLGRDLLNLRRVLWVSLAGATGVLIHTLIGNLDGAAQLATSTEGEFDFWQSSRVVDYAITEFPFFTQIWADLHPHAIALPFTLLLISLAYVGIKESGTTRINWWLIWGASSALVVGSIGVINSWDLPLMFLLLGAAIITIALRTPVSVWPVRVALGLGLWASVGVIAWVLFFPFFSSFVALVGGVDVAETGTSVNQYLLHFGIMLGILAAAGLVYVSHRAAHLSADLPRLLVSVLGGLAGVLLGTILFGVQNLSAIVTPITIAVIGGAALGSAVSILAPRGSLGPTLDVVAVAVSALMGVLATTRPTAAVLIALVMVGALLWGYSPNRPAVSLAGICLAGAAGVTFGADLFYVVDDLSGSDWQRMNTVFKFYLQAWTLFAIPAALAFAWLASMAARSAPSANLRIISEPSIRRGHDEPAVASDQTGLRQMPVIALGCAVFLLALGTVYPVVGTPARLAVDMPTSPTTPTLDGLAWMPGAEITNSLGEPINLGDDLGAIYWLRENAVGNPVILEASIGPYRGNGARITAGTGFPAVLGWDRHQRQQRPADGINQRLFDVRRFYTTDNIEEKRRILRQYRVRYVIVGDIERGWRIDRGFAGATQTDELYSTPEGIDSIDALVGDDLRVAFQFGTTTVYEVVPFPRLEPTAASGLES